MKWLSDDLLVVLHKKESAFINFFVKNHTFISLDHVSVFFSFWFSFFWSLKTCAGKIRSLAILDRETASKYWLTIQAEDMVSTPFTSILHVFVRVLDRNDHIPLPSRPIYFAKIPENSPADTVVVKVSFLCVVLLAQITFEMHVRS